MALPDSLTSPHLAVWLALASIASVLIAPNSRAAEMTDAATTDTAAAGAATADTAAAGAATTDTAASGAATTDTAASGAATTDTAAVLARIREAVGYQALADHPEGLFVEGAADCQALKGSYSLLFTPDGKFLEKMHLGRDQIAAFDGTTGWAVDWSGTPHVLELADLEAAQTSIWVETGRWLAADGPFRIDVQDRTGDKELRLHLALKQGLREMDLYVDRSTWLPTRLTARRMGIGETWEFHDPRGEMGLSLAHRIVHRYGSQADTYAVRRVGPAPHSADDPFKPALDLPHDTEFHSGVPTPFAVKRVASGHLFVKPKINGIEVGWFALDTGTGAGMTITAKVADRLGMPAFGKVIQGGAGKLGVGQLREGKTFELGSLRINKSIYVEMPQEFCDMMKRMFGIELVGTCGYDLFSRSVVELDLKNQTACLFDPTGYEPKGGNWQKLHLNHKIPCIQVVYEGREGLFQFDTGAGSVVVFHAPAIKKLKLLEKRHTRPMKVGGVGGTLDARIGTLDWFQVGRQRIEKPTALFLSPHEGALDDPYVTGTFGSGILKNRKIVFDYPRRRIAFSE
jgi:Aspartyl protease